MISSTPSSAPMILPPRLGLISRISFSTRKLHEHVNWTPNSLILVLSNFRVSRNIAHSSRFLQTSSASSGNQSLMPRWCCVFPAASSMTTCHLNQLCSIANPYLPLMMPILYLRLKKYLVRRSLFSLTRLLWGKRLLTRALNPPPTRLPTPPMLAIRTKTTIITTVVPTTTIIIVYWQRQPY